MYNITLYTNQISLKVYDNGGNLFLQSRRISTGWALHIWLLHQTIWLLYVSKLNIQVGEEEQEDMTKLVLHLVLQFIWHSEAAVGLTHYKGGGTIYLTGCRAWDPKSITIVVTLIQDMVKLTYGIRGRKDVKNQMEW